MQVGSLLVGLSLALIAAVAIADPLQRAKGRASPKRPVLRVSTQDRRRQALLAIRDLDFDFHTGKVEGEDYLPLRRQLMADAARLAESADGAGAEIDPKPISRSALDIEVVLCQCCGQGVRAGDRYCSRCGARLERQCSICGVTLGPEDKFCGGCGSPTDLEPEG